MKLIESKAEYLPQESGIEGIYKMIEVAGRTAYRSQDNITPDSAKAFVDRMIKNQHGACLEHGTVYLKIQVEDDGYHGIKGSKYLNNPYSKVNNPNWYNYITTNLRVLVENDWLDDLKYLCEPTQFHEKRYTMKFTCARIISQMHMRHRAFSFLQESQRYCNYSKDKFGGEITFVKPSWNYFCSNHNGVIEDMKDGDLFKEALEKAEYLYLTLISKGWTPQQARQVLPNATKTEFVMTGFASDWRHYFDLRYFEKTGKADPEEKDLATKTMVAMQEAGIWDDIMSKPSKFK